MEPLEGGAACHSLTPPLTHKLKRLALRETCHSSDIRSDLIMTLMYAHIEREAIKEKNTFSCPKWGGAVQIGFSSLFFYLLAKLSFSLGFKEPFFRRKV